VHKDPPLFFFRGGERRSLMRCVRHIIAKEFEDVKQAYEE
jgi:hypothetical protein